MAVVGWLATVLTGRYSLATPVLPLTGLLTMGVIVVLTLVLGIRVLRWRNGKKKKILNPILAAWTLVLAQACAYTGAVLLGWHAGIFIEQLRLWNLRSNQDITWEAAGDGRRRAPYGGRGARRRAVLPDSARGRRRRIGDKGCRVSAASLRRKANMPTEAIDPPASTGPGVTEVRHRAPGRRGRSGTWSQWPCCHFPSSWS